MNIKKIISGLCVLTPMYVHAASGSAVIPHFLGGLGTSGTSDHWYTMFYITNITDADISVNVKCFDYNGNLLTDDGSANSGKFLARRYNTYNDGLSAYSVSLTIAPHSTTSFYYGNTSTSAAEGYGTIEWTQDGSNTKGLTAFARTYRHLQGVTASSNWNESQYGIQINAGLPF